MDSGLTRRSLLITAGTVLGGIATVGLTGCSTTPTIPEPTTSPTGPVRRQLDQALSTIAGGNKNFGVFIHDVRTGGVYSYSGDYTSQSASMAKPMIVAMAERKSRSQGVPMSAQNIDYARKAITHSDNDAASALWTYAGYPGYTTLAKAAGMPHTHLDSAKPDQWSWTWTTPRDQVHLVDALATGRTPALTKTECAFIYDLMGQVEDDQTWGIGQPKSASVQVHLKNGWVQFQSTDKLWAVNSMGSVVGDGRDYRICVMTRVPDFPTGRELTSTVGKWVFNILGSGKL